MFQEVMSGGGSSKNLKTRIINGTWYANQRLKIENCLAIAIRMSDGLFLYTHNGEVYSNGNKWTTCSIEDNSIVINSSYSGANYTFYGVAYYLD